MAAEQLQSWGGRRTEPRFPAKIIWWYPAAVHEGFDICPEGAIFGNSQPHYMQCEFPSFCTICLLFWSLRVMDSNSQHPQLDYPMVRGGGSGSLATSGLSIPALDCVKLMGYQPQKRDGGQI